MELDSGVLLRGVFESAPDAVLVVDDAGCVVMANLRCQEVFGCAPEDLVGGPVERLVPARSRDLHPGHRARYGAEPDARPMGLLRLAAVRGDGTEFPAEISLAPIEVEDTTYVCATVRDITDRIRDEERFRDLLEAAPDATVIVDAGGRIVLANNRMLDVLGHQREELLGLPVASLAATPGPAAVRERLERYLEAPASVPMGYSREFRVWHRAGHEVPVEVSLSPLETTEGVLVSIALRDVTERRRLEAASQRLRDELIATVSHELRTPLTSIIGYAELMADLDETDLSPVARRLLRVIERNAARELRLVDDLLTMASLDGDSLVVERAPVELAEVCRRVVENQSLRARDAGIALTCGGAGAVAVTGDFHRLVQVVENLVANALKFTGRDGRVEVLLAETDDRAVVEVRDTGVGVPAEELPRLFDRLYRGPQAIADQVQGAGLGLPIVRAIVEAHGGEVTVESEVGVGTAVRVAVPLAERDAPTAA